MDEKIEILLKFNKEKLAELVVDLLEKDLLAPQRSSFNCILIENFNRKF